MYYVSARVVVQLLLVISVYSTPYLTYTMEIWISTLVLYQTFRCQSNISDEQSR